MVTGIIILLSSICTYFISRQALLPLRRLSQEVNQIEVQNLSEALEVPATNDEISRLTISFNKMLARLDEAFTAQKQFSANAAHELRTPLAVIQTNLEVFARRKHLLYKIIRRFLPCYRNRPGDFPIWLKSSWI